MSPATTAALDRAHLAFALAVHRGVAPDPTVPACWSPYSVASALGLAGTGARGQTRDEIAQLLLGDPAGSLAEQAAMLSAAAELDDEPGRSEPPLLGVSNTLWTRADLPITAQFTDDVRSWPNGTVREAPFATDSETARGMINAEVDDTTRGLIPELVRRGELDSKTVAALVNALYLKSSWRNAFPEGATAPGPFHAPGGQLELPTMRLVKQFGYAHRNGWQVVVLPALGGLDAITLLPDTELGQAEPALDAAALADLFSAPAPARLELYLPRFRVKVRSPLTQALQELGVHRMFTDAAEFSGISEVPLAVDKVLHDAVLKVDEHGFEGAAATAMVMRMAAAVRQDPPIVVRVDRPFLFLVRHRATGAVYFLTRFTGS
ncbi:MAG TPA: serpin family protein [Pseudonocardiaceae bacterium]|nr:serpin family protein [Pseudonocardiaceae bacterium]